MVWFVYNWHHRLVGRITFERRFCSQRDFVLNPRRVMLMSFNELYFITSNQPDGWGIDPTALPPDFCLYIKQLRNPVTKSVMEHMKEADASSFQFIKLGTCVT
jgi:hypothetical protein